jgi:hypothetical protein
VVHTELEDLSRSPTLESSLINGLEPEIAFETQLKALAGGHNALILRTSHIGGHKFAGNVIVCLSPIPSPLRTNILLRYTTPKERVSGMDELLHTMSNPS